jgi:xanthine dehydrogenase YagS FAD-binding subunit
VRRDYPVLAEALLAGASGQLRNLATTAGNLMQRVRCPYFRDNISPCHKREPGTGCAALTGYNRMHAILGTSEACIATHPSDMCVALAALDAQVVVSRGADERVIPLLDFHLLPGDTPEREHALASDELITAVILPPPLAGARSHYLKVRDRESYEFALVSAAVVVALDGDHIREARVALGGVGTKPWRSSEAETILRGAAATPVTFLAAAEAALAGAVPRAHNAFKLNLARRVLERALVTVTRA